MVTAPQVPPMVNCPTCNKVVAWVAENRYRPFCTKRCKAIDLGAWAAEEYSVPARDDIPPGARQGKRIKMRMTLS